MQEFIPQFDRHRYIAVSWHGSRINITFALSVCLDITFSVDIKRLQNRIYEILKGTASKNNIYIAEVPISSEFTQALFKFYLTVSFKEKHKHFLT